jgi:hypothetical protein
MLQALQTDFIHVDERDIHALITAVNKLSGQLNFHNEVGEWRWNTFFQWEPLSIIAQIASLKIDIYLSDYQIVRRKLMLNPSEVAHQNEVISFFEIILQHVEDLDKKIQKLPDSLEIKTYYTSSLPKINALITAIVTKLQPLDAEELVWELQNHLLNKKIQTLFGLLTEWKTKSHEELYKLLDNYSENSPHYALFLTFLRLFKYAQDDLNTFTKRHLDFYYKDILQLAPEKAIADAVHLYVEPHQNSKPFLIEKGTVFPAGKDIEGHNKFYEASADTTINQAKLATIFGGYKNENRYYFQNLTELNATGDSWKPFTKDHIAQDFGLLIASPLLYLKGGQRTITITFTDRNSAKVGLTTEHYDFYLSGEEEWIPVTASTDKLNQLVIVLTANDSPIIPYDSEFHEGVQLDTPFPVLKIVAKDGELHTKSFSTVSIVVDVAEYGLFSLYNDTGLVDHTKSFQPFGAIPKTGLGLTFSSNEFFMKKGAKGKLVTTTKEKIVAGTKVSKDIDSIAAKTVFASNTTNGTPTDIVQTSSYTTSWNFINNTDAQILNNGNWEEESNWGSAEEYNLYNTDAIPYEFVENEELTPDRSNGFARILLTDPSYSGEKYLQNFIDQAKSENSTILPYIPTVEAISFTYEASSDAENPVELYQLYPEGYQEVTSEKTTVLPSISNEGELFIGLQNVEDGNSVSLLLQVTEGTANPRQVPAEVSWSYLHGNTWTPFEPEQLGDETNGLTQSGLIQLKAPENLAIFEQKQLPAGFWWVKIAIKERIDAICDIVGIHTQALKAVLTDFENIGIEFIEHSPAETISKLFQPKNEIKAIKQPYVSFGGKPTDTDTVFYQNSSERLRHKDKAITTWDWEKLVLHHFPEVFRVKCLNHHRYDTTEISNTSAGYVTVIPVANARNTEVPDTWKPLVSLGTMKRIQEFLQSKTSPHVRIAVKPPQLEKLELDFSVKYKDISGADSRLYDQLLMDAINTYLSPWAFKNTTTITFQSEIEKSRLLQLVEQQFFVDYIMDFKVNHLILEASSDAIAQQMNDVEKIVPKTAYTLFVPHSHKINPITKACCI